MSELRSPLRQRVLVKSAQDVLGDPSIDLAAYGWRRGKWAFIYPVIFGVVATGSGVALGLAPGIVLAMGAAAVAISSLALTDYRVVASSKNRLVMCRSSRIRQFAVAEIEELPRSTTVKPTGGSMLATEWRIGTTELTIAKSSEQMMTTIAKRHGR